MLDPGSRHWIPTPPWPWPWIHFLSLLLLKGPTLPPITTAGWLWSCLCTISINESICSKAAFSATWVSSCCSSFACSTSLREDQGRPYARAHTHTHKHNQEPMPAAVLSWGLPVCSCMHIFRHSSTHARPCSLTWGWTRHRQVWMRRPKARHPRTTLPGPPKHSAPPPTHSHTHTHTHTHSFNHTSGHHTHAPCTHPPTSSASALSCLYTMSATGSTSAVRGRTRLLPAWLSSRSRACTWGWLSLQRRGGVGGGGRREGQLRQYAAQWLNNNIQYTTTTTTYKLRPRAQISMYIPLCQQRYTLLSRDLYKVRIMLATPHSGLILSILTSACPHTRSSCGYI